MSMDTASAWKVITCFLPLANALELVEGLKEEKGILTSAFTTARGLGTRKSVAFGVWDEIAVVTISVAAQRADEVFAYVFDKGKLDRPKGGVAVMHAVNRHTPFTIPELPESEN